MQKGCTPFLSVFFSASSHVVIVCSLSFNHIPPSLHQSRSRLWVETVGCVGRVAGASAGLLSRQGGTGWQAGGNGLLKTHCWESDWASAWSKACMHTHTYTHIHKEGMVRKVGGVQTWNKDISLLIYKIWHHQSAFSSSLINIPWQRSHTCWCTYSENTSCRLVYSHSSANVH